MTPASYRPFLEPVLGKDATDGVISVAERHKTSAARAVYVPSFVVVAMADEIVRLQQAAATAAFRGE